MSVDETASKKVGTGFGWGAFWSGFVPGLLQYRLGQRPQAIQAFVSCTLVFFVGWLLVRDRIFYYAVFAPEGPGDSAAGSVVNTVLRFVPFALPEVLNLPATALGGTLAYDSGFEAVRLWRLPRPMEDIGSWLTAASGMLAAFWAAAGFWQLRLARDGGPSPQPATVHPALAAGLSWLVPGLGHWRAGQPDKGALMGVAVLVVFALGLVFSAGHAVDRQIAPIWWIGQNLFGGGSLFASLVTAPPKMQFFPEELGLGTVLGTVAGLMNLVVMIDAYTVAERSVFPIVRPQEAT